MSSKTMVRLLLTEGCFRMDVEIFDKDIVINTCGDAQYIDDTDELLQRVRIACSIKKGDFVYDRNMGSFANKLKVSDPMLNKKLEMIFKEATVSIPYTDLKVTKTEVENNKIKATVDVYCGDEKGTLEVSVDADL